MLESFTKEFEMLRNLGSEVFLLRGSTLIVEILPPEEIKTKSGLIVSTPRDHVAGQSVTAHRVEVGKVLMAGQGYWNDNKTVAEQYGKEIYLEQQGGFFEPLEAQPGAIVILPQYSAQLMSHFPGIQRPTENRLAMVKMDQVLAYYPNQEAYERAKVELNV